MNELENICYSMSQGDDSFETIRKYLELIGENVTEESILKQRESMYDPN